MREDERNVCVREEGDRCQILNTHGFVRDKLMGEKLDWWMAVTCCNQGVFRMCVHELGESRVDEACVDLISVILNIVIARTYLVIPFRRTKPSTTGVTLAVE